ncbi:MAG: hypothetical protein AB7S77_24160, partial [Desulfatirhabdiaceae bacterium]
MMPFQSGDKVTHPEYGQGIVKQILGGTAVVNFYGDDLDVDVHVLTPVSTVAPPVKDHPSQDHSQDKIAFRKAFEAINLGVAPPDSSQLIDL